MAVFSPSEAWEFQIRAVSQWNTDWHTLLLLAFGLQYWSRLSLPTKYTEAMFTFRLCCVQCFMNDFEKLKVYKELIPASALIYLIASFILLQAIIISCQSVRKQITRYNPHGFFKSGFPFLCWETVYCKQQLYSTVILWLSMVGTLFLSARKVAIQLVKAYIFRRKASISSVNLVALEELIQSVWK